MGFSIFKVYKHHNLIVEHFHCSKRNLGPISNQPTSLQATTYLLSVSIIVPIVDVHRNEKTKFVVLCEQLVSCSIVFLKFIHIVAHSTTSLLLTAKQFYGFTTFCFLVFSLCKRLYSLKLFRNPRIFVSCLATNKVRQNANEKFSKLVKGKFF